MAWPDCHGYPQLPGGCEQMSTSARLIICSCRHRLQVTDDCDLPHCMNMLPSLVELAELTPHQYVRMDASWQRQGASPGPRRVVPSPTRQRISLGMLGLQCTPRSHPPSLLLAAAMPTKGLTMLAGPEGRWLQPGRQTARWKPIPCKGLAHTWPPALCASGSLASQTCQ